MVGALVYASASPRYSIFISSLFHGLEHPALPPVVALFREPFSNMAVLFHQVWVMPTYVPCTVPWLGVLQGHGHALWEAQLVAARSIDACSAVCSLTDWNARPVPASFRRGAGIPLCEVAVRPPHTSFAPSCDPHTYSPHVR